MFLVLPAIVVQNLGCVLSLIYVATYLKAYVIPCVLLIILVNYISLKSYYKCKPIPLDKSLYKQNKEEPAYSQLFMLAETEKNEKFMTAVLTSWMSPCTAWVNKLDYKSYFMLVSSAARLETNIFVFWNYLKLVEYYLANCLDDAQTSTNWNWTYILRPELWTTCQNKFLKYLPSLFILFTFGIEMCWF